MRSAITIAAAIFVALTPLALADFAIENNEGKLTVLEDGKPVLVYNYEPVKPPEGVDNRYERACYVHPLYGLDGDVLTQDFPGDHYHHRGVFWGWPKSKVGERPADVWTCVDIYQHHEQWTAKEAGADIAVIGVRNFWSYNDAPEKQVVREEVTYRILPADDKGRAIDIEATFTNLTDEVVTFQGSTSSISRTNKDQKGYGGFNYRPDANRQPFTFTTIDGVCGKDALKYETPWTDISSKIKEGGSVSGLAIFQHPKNPGYPHHGWIFRHYGFLGACWPHVEAHKLAPGESFELRYRLYVHRGTAVEAEVAKCFEEYAK